MKVNGTSGAGASTGPWAAKSAPAAGGFSLIQPSQTAEAGGVAAPASAAPVSSLDALIALQAVGGPLERRRRAMGRATNILDALDTLKADLLDGQLGAVGIERLAQAVRDQRDLTDDARLEAVLDEIETRAAVELAKIEAARTSA
jgi:hypothetical protein